MVSSNLKAKQLHKHFIQAGRTLNILSSIDVEFEQGKSYAITGASGSGKSTFLHLLGALDKPSSGDIFLNGKSIFSFNQKERSLFLNQTIGFIFQFHYLIKELTVLENIIVPGLIGGLERSSCQKRACDLLKMVDMSDRANAFPSQLSGGQQQRVSVLRAIFNNPKFLLADEPTGNLDSNNAEIIVDFLLKLKNEFNMSIILCSHDSAIYSKMGIVFRLSNGKLSRLSK